MADAPINFNGLDTTVHGPIRLGVLTALRTDGPLDFTTLKKRLEVADGALGIHLQKLEAAGYVSVTKEHIGRRPRSTYHLTRAGAAAFATYLENLRRLLDGVPREPGRGA